MKPSKVCFFCHALMEWEIIQQWYKCPRCDALNVNGYWYENHSHFVDYLEFRSMGIVHADSWYNRNPLPAVGADSRMVQALEEE